MDLLRKQAIYYVSIASILINEHGMASSRLAREDSILFQDFFFLIEMIQLKIIFLRYCSKIYKCFKARIELEAPSGQDFCTFIQVDIFHVT